MRFFVISFLINHKTGSLSGDAFLIKIKILIGNDSCRCVVLIVVRIRIRLLIRTNCCTFWAIVSRVSLLASASPPVMLRTRFVPAS